MSFSLLRMTLLQILPLMLGVPVRAPFVHMRRVMMTARGAEAPHRQMPHMIVRVVDAANGVMVRMLRA